ncbi:hypothetical protein [Sphingomonas endolithica]|uniref:hypothetical protein n=1 Tax=Sphingomonas endolithica TaxID=2972485 RepID=UPI0021AF31EF|nr:hypothetical protein [Sphingomonas sp. ZFBP2030]
MMPIALLLALAAQTPPAAAAPGLPIAALPRQEMPARGCAAYLFTRGEKPVFMAMASADPAQLRLSLNGTITDIARAAQSGAGGFGFAGVTDYAGGDVRATLDMTIETRADVTDGAAVSAATLRIDRTGQDSVVMPLAGIVGCAK